MYETHDSIDSVLSNKLGHFDPELPEPLDHWSADDFDDILPVRRHAS